MKKIFHLLLFVGLIFLCLTKSHCREVVVKTDILYGITTTPNSSIEATLGKKGTLNYQVVCNPCILISKEKKEKGIKISNKKTC